jgi:hypothetical protein
MPDAQIPVNDSLFVSDNIAGVGNFSPFFMDGYVDQFGNSYRRPALGSPVANVGNTVALTGGVKFKRQGTVNVIFVDSAGNISKLNKVGSGLERADITGDKLTGRNRPTFALSSDGLTLLIADGGRIVFTDGSTATAYIGDADAPLNSTHIANLNLKIAASNVDSETWQWAEVGDFDDFLGLSFVSSETKPDNIIALIEHNREILTAGSETFEPWRDDGVTPWVRNFGRYVARGLGAPYSLIKLGNTLAYINTEGKLDILLGNAPQSVSGPVDLLIQTFDQFDDAKADKIEIAGRKFCVITFPSANVTLAYDYELKKWYRWGYWNKNKYQWDAWLVGCHVFVPEWNAHLVGDRRNTGKIFELSVDNTDDDGDEVRYLRQTYHLTYGTLEEKLNRFVKGLVKRGQAAVTEENNPVLMLRYKDDNSYWSKEIWVDMGATGDLKIDIDDQDIQNYFTTRQWEISYTAKTPFAHTAFIENFEVNPR